MQAHSSACAWKARRARCSARLNPVHVPRRRSRRSRWRARQASSTTTSGNVLRAVRRPDRPLPGRGLERLGVQGERRVATGRCRQGRAEERDVVLCTGRRSRMPAAVDSELRSEAGCYRVFAQDDAGKQWPRRTPSSSGRAEVRGLLVGECIGKHRGLVRAYAPGAVKVDALPWRAGSFPLLCLVATLVGCGRPARAARRRCG